MNFAAFNFLGMPRGFLLALLALNFLVQTRALVTDGRNGPRTAVATAPHSAAREDQGYFPADVMPLGFGVTKKVAGGVRGSAAGIQFRQSMLPAVSVCSLSPAREVPLLSLPRGVQAGVNTAPHCMEHHAI